MNTGKSPGKSPGKSGATPGKSGATPGKTAGDTRGTGSPAGASACGKTASPFPVARKRVPGGEGGTDKLLSQLKEAVQAAPGGKLSMMEGWNITVKERFGGASAGSSDAVRPDTAPTRQDAVRVPPWRSLLPSCHRRSLPPAEHLALVVRG
jgi:hypothetical protein